MTEKEALKLMESMQISPDCELIKTIDFKATVIKALEDLQQYRETGSIEEFKFLKQYKVLFKPNIYCKVKNAEYARCPCCKLTTVLYNGMRPEHCPKCGVKFDWQQSDD